MNARRLAIGTAILTAGRAGSQALGILSTLVTARLLGPEDFGLVGMAMAIFFLAGALTELPVSAALIRMKQVERADIDTAWTLNVLRGALASTLMLVSAWPASIILGDSRLLTLVVALSLYPLILGCRNSAFDLHARALDFRPEAVTELAVRLSAFASAAAIAWMTGSYWALPLSLLLSGVAALVLSFIFKPYRPRLTLGRARAFLSFSIWMSLARICETLRSASASLFIGRMQSPSHAGALSLASRFSDQMEFLLVAPAERSLYVGLRASEPPSAEHRALYLGALAALGTLTLPACIGAALLAEQIMTLLAGPDWSLAGRALQFTAAMAAITALAAPAMAAAAARGDVRWVFASQALATLAHIPLLLLLAGLWGFHGAMSALAIGGFVSAAVSLAYPVLRLGVTWRAHASVLMRPILACLAMIVTVQLTLPLASAVGHPAIAVAALASVGALAYSVTLLTLWRLSACPGGIESEAISAAGALWRATLRARLRRERSI
jgi:PST family polysaccharide transporter